MTTLRFLLILLLLLNALAFGAIKGWFGFAPPQGEPERITNQLHPERISVLNPATVTVPNAAPPADAETSTEPAPAPSTVEVESPPAATLCQAWSGLNASEAERLGARITAAGLKPVKRRIETPSSWWVRIPPLPNRDAAERRAKELRAQGISDLFIVQESGPNQFAISLGLFKTESSSNQHLAEMKAKGVRGAGIAVRTSTEYVVELTAAQTALDAINNNDPLSRNHTSCAR